MKTAALLRCCHPAELSPPGRGLTIPRLRARPEIGMSYRPEDPDLLWLGQIRSYDLSGLFAWDNWHDLKRTESVPVQDPFLNQPQIIAFHKLKATVEVWLNPTIDIFEAIRKATPFVPEVRINRNGILIVETFDQHKEHFTHPFRLIDLMPDRVWL